jgi:hypothetical protein
MFLDCSVVRCDAYASHLYSCEFVFIRGSTVRLRATARLRDTHAIGKIALCPAARADRRSVPYALIIDAKRRQDIFAISRIFLYTNKNKYHTYSRMNDKQLTERYPAMLGEHQ